jgi:uncharacterized membrane protein
MHTIHPFIVHFPVALLTAAFVFECIARLKANPGLSQVGWWLQLVGTFGVILAALSGVVAEGAAGTALLRAEGAFGWHEQLAFVASVAFAILLFFRLSAHRALPAAWPGLYLVAFALCVILLLVTAWFGGELVFTYGIGVSSPNP